MSEITGKPAVEGKDVLDYLKDNIGRSIYIVKGSHILGELRWEGKANKVLYTSATTADEKGQPISKEIPFNRVSKIDDYWQQKVNYKPQYYTVHGMKLMLRVWEGLEPEEKG